MPSIRLALVVLLVFAACADPDAPDGGEVADAGTISDSGVRDAGSSADMGVADAGGALDTGVDAGAGDASPTDLGDSDAGFADAEPADLGPPDLGSFVCPEPALPGTATAYTGPAPVAYYTFDRDHLAGASVLDVAQVNDASANSAALAGLRSAGRVHESAGLDGNAATISATPPASSVFSAVIWIRPGTPPGANGATIANLGHGPMASQGWGVELLANGNVRAYVEGGTSAANRTVATSSTCLSTSAWTHVALSFDGNTLQLYQNGVLQQATPATLPTIAFGSNGLLLGNDSLTQNAPFQGELDELALFGQALSATQIGQIYLAGRDGQHFVCPVRCGDVTLPENIPRTGLVAWLRGDIGVQSAVDGLVCGWCDASGRHHDFVQANNALKPRPLASGIGGQASLEFPIAGSQYLIAGGLAITSTSGRTYVAAYRVLDRNVRTTILLEGLGGTPGTYVELDVNTFNSQFHSHGLYVTNNAYDSNIPTSTSAVIHTLRLANMVPGQAVLGQLSGFVNNAPMTLTRTPGGLGNGTIQTFAPNYAGVGPTSGGAQISEFLIYGRPLSEPERDQVEAYLAARYGITRQ